MLRKTETTFRRHAPTYPGDVDRTDFWHVEVVRRNTWWLLWVIPVYTRERVIVGA